MAIIKYYTLFVISALAYFIGCIAMGVVLLMAFIRNKIGVRRKP